MELGHTPLSLPEEAVLLESVFTYAAEGMVLIGPDFRVKRFNHSFAQQVSASHSTLQGVEIGRIIPDWDANLASLCTRVKESREPLVTKTMKIVPVFGQDRTFAGWFLLFQGGIPGSPKVPPHRKFRIEQLLSAEVVLNNLPVGIAVYDSVSLRLKWANPVYRSFLEEPNGGLGLTLQETVPGAKQNGLVGACHYVAVTGEPFCAPEFRIGGFKRGVVYWRLTIIRLEMQEPAAPTLLFIVVDLTEQIKTRKQKEELMNIAETGLAQLEAVVNSLTEGIVITDPRRQVVFMNPAGLKIMGFTDSDEALRPIAEYNQRFRFKELSGCTLKPNADPFTRPLQGETFFNLELVIEDFGQERSWIGSFSGTPVRNRQNQLILGVVVFRDITNVKQAEQEREKLLASEHKARTEAERQDLQKQVLLDNIGEGVLVTAPDGRLLLANKVALEITGVDVWPETIEELLSPTALRRKDGTQLGPDEILTTRLLTGDYFTEEEYRLKMADQTERRLLISGNAAKDRQGQIFMNLVTLRDVTKLRNLEQIREDYLHMVSHDLRSPLAVILSHAQLLGLIAKEDSKIANSAQVIAISALRMSNMIADLVDSTRIESGQLVLKLACLELDQFLRDFLLRMRGVMEVDRIRIVSNGSLRPVVADPNRLERIFVNFLSNALKYSPKETKVEIRFWLEDALIIVAIRDEGPGINPDDLSHVFDRYYRACTSNEEGIGLGLYIVKRLVEAHGGTVWAESAPGMGSTFFFTLPVDG